MSVLWKSLGCFFKHNGLMLSAAIVCFSLIPLTASASAYFVYDSYQGTWSDAKKIWDNDENLCWAATASNVLFSMGWGYLSSETFVTEDEIYQYYKDHFPNRGGRAVVGIWWWFDPNLKIISPAPTGRGGGFLPEYSDFEYDNYGQNKYLRMIIEEDDIEIKNPLHSIAAALREGQAVILNIVGPSSHYITLWGYEYETGSDGLQNITGLYITDSDDSFYGLRYYAVNERLIYPDHTQVYFLDYRGSSDWRVNRAYGLYKAPVENAVSIKGSLWLLGVNWIHNNIKTYL